MTQTDFLTATAVVSGRPARRNGREVRRSENGRMDVLLHGAPLLSVIPEAATIEIDGGALPTRKSTRAANAVLASFTPCRVLTRNSRWYIRTGDGELLDYTGRIAEVNIA